MALVAFTQSGEDYSSTSDESSSSGGGGALVALPPKDLPAVHPELCSVVPAFRERGGANLDWERGIPHREGADTFTTSGTSKRRSFPGLNADEQVRHKGELVYPNLFVSVAREHVAAFLLKPTGPKHTRSSAISSSSLTRWPGRTSIPPTRWISGIW